MDLAAAVMATIGNPSVSAVEWGKGYQEATLGNLSAIANRKYESK